MKYIIERSTPTSSRPKEVRFQFHIGYDVFLSVTAEVVTETDAEGFNHSNNVTILECLEMIGGGELFPYEKGMNALRAALEQKAIELT